MAKIKIKGQDDMISVSQSVAQEAKRIKFDENIPNDTTIDLGNITIEKRDIRAVFTDSEASSSFQRGEEEYWKHKDAWRALSAKEKAVKCFSHYLLFCKGFKVSPSPEDEIKVATIAEAFFEQHPKRCLMDYELFFDLARIKRSENMEFYTKKFLEQVERNEQIEEESNVRNSKPKSLGVFGIAYEPE